LLQLKVKEQPIQRGIMSELLKAVEAAAYKLAKAQAKRDVIQRSLNGIIAEQERRAAAKEAAKKAKDVQN